MQRVAVLTEQQQQHLNDNHKTGKFYKTTYLLWHTAYLFFPGVCHSQCPYIKYKLSHQGPAHCSSMPVPLTVDWTSNYCPLPTFFLFFFKFIIFVFYFYFYFSSYKPPTGRCVNGGDIQRGVIALFCVSDKSVSFLIFYIYISIYLVEEVKKKKWKVKTN